MTLIQCPKCGDDPKVRLISDSFTQIKCENERCNSDFYAVHKLAVIAEVRWNRQAEDSTNTKERK